MEETLNKLMTTRQNYLQAKAQLDEELNEKLNQIFTTILAIANNLAEVISLKI